MNIVWLKRDLRTQDHAPLFAAEQAGIPYLIIFFFEPTLIDHPDTSLRHLQFCYHSVRAMNERLEPFNRKVDMLYGEAEELFSFFLEKYQVRQVFSHQESGIQLTWDRDKAICQIT